MPLKKQHITVPFGAGVDTKTAERLIEPPFLLTARNVSYDTPGEIGKARGYESVVSTGIGAGAVPRTLGALGDARLTLTDNGIYVYRGATDSNLNAQVSPPAWPMPCAPSIRRFVRPDSRTVLCDSAQVGNFLCVAWDNGTDLRIRVVDRTTMQDTLVPLHTGVAAAIAPRVLVLGTTFVVLFWNAARIRAVTITNGTAITAVTDVSGLNTNANYDAIVNNAGDNIHIVTSDAATNDVRLFRVGLVAGVPTQNTTATLAGVNGSGTTAILHHSLGRVFFAFAAPATRLRMATINDDYTGVSGVINMAALTGTIVNGVTLVEANLNNGLGFTGVWAAWAESSDVAPSISDPTLASFTNLAGVAGDMDKVRWQGLSTVPAAVGVAQEVAHMGLAGKGFRPTTAMVNTPTVACFIGAYRYSGATILPDGTRAAGNLQPCLYVVRIAQDAPAAVATSTLSCLVRLNQDRAVYGHSFMPQVYSTGTNQFRFACISRAVSVDSNTDTSFDGVDICDLDFAPTTLARAERSGCAFFGGGVLSYYDGDMPCESSLNVRPERPYFINAAAGNVDDAEHRYVVVWEYADAAGNLHRSAPSPELTVPAQGAARQFTIHFPRIGPYTQRTGQDARFSVIAAVYRTSTDGNFHRVVSGVPVASVVIGLVNLTDNLSDADALNNETLYTTGGFLRTTPPPHPDDFIFTADRMWLASRNELWYTKPLEALVTPEFNNLQVFYIAQGDITALAKLDDKIIIFTESEVLALTGDGPNAAGTGGSFSLPELISSDVGCVSPRSVVAYADGIFFQSAKGLYKIDRALDVTYAGAAVEDDLVSVTTGLPNATIRRALLVASRNELRFLVPENGTVIVYDYVGNAWHVRTNFDAAVDAIVIDERYHWIRSDLRGRRERLSTDAAPFTDLSAADVNIAISTTLETAWMKFDGIQGFARVMKALFLGTRVGAHTLTVQARYDYEAAYTTTWMFTDAEITAIRYRTTDASATRMQLQMHIPRQKVQAIAFRITDTPAVATGGYRITSLEMEYGRRGRPMPLPAGAQE